MHANTVFSETTTQRGLPLASLLAFAMTGFIAILTETLPAGLLPEIGMGLDVSQVMAGQLVSIYALGSLLAAIPLTVLTSGWRRKKVLLLAVGTFLIFNTITTLSFSYWLTMAARFMSGVAAGLAWGILAGYARRLVPAEMQGRALAIAMVGIPVALSLGTPAGAWLGSMMGWRVPFGIMAALAVILFIWTWVAVPDLPGQQADRRLPVWQVFQMPGVRPVLAVIFLWMTAHNILYTFIGPFLQLSGLTGNVGLILLIFGIAALIGIWITGMLVDRHLRNLVLLSLVALAAVSVALAAGMREQIVVFVAVIVWGWSFGGASTQMQTAAADAAGNHVDVVQAMVTTAWNLAIASGGVIGGLLLNNAGAVSFPWALLIFMAVALIIAWCAKKHAFRPGAREPLVK
ncbi:MFS transporter [Pantoea agglomerans]|uniref:Purine ribonucleoside efflux pump nepI n=3 Tax=Enterobacter agglomerans TaxID=549 RepID=A0A379LRW4_ENTAG|nr:MULTISPECIES: MFS transporter [Pantoea]ERM09569.1 MFS transporter [Pantoea agglomerans Tx10]KEY40446.1 MFS family transporter [Pantoea agglomerans]MCX2905271.1 MFS transporter [[Curtobacterium] plantarum]MDK4218446.1 MFS transporter [Pantoea agglomerans]MDQ0631616.1 putative MFS family arabinose efflux permease [Pantoea agglomerans]